MLVDVDLVVEAEWTVDGMSLKSEMGDGGFVMETELTNEGI